MSHTLTISIAPEQLPAILAILAAGAALAPPTAGVTPKPEGKKKEKAAETPMHTFASLQARIVKISQSGQPGKDALKTMFGQLQAKKLTELKPEQYQACHEALEAIERNVPAAEEDDFSA